MPCLVSWGLLFCKWLYRNRRLPLEVCASCRFPKPSKGNHQTGWRSVFYKSDSNYQGFWQINDMSTNGDTAVDRDIVSPLESRAASPQPVYPRTILNDNGPSNMSMEAPEHQRATLNHGQPYAGPTQARNFDDFTKHKVQHRDPVNARPILRATSLMLCAVVLATNIAEYTVIYTGTRYSYYFGGPDLLTGVPVVRIPHRRYLCCRSQT